MASKFQKLEEEYLSLLTEFNNLKCKLECKTDSLLILSHELEQCRSERDQYRLMAEQLRERYSALKRRIEGWGPSLMGVYDVDGLKCKREKSLAQLLCELKDQNRILKHENEDLKLRLDDAKGDIKILREEIMKQQSDGLSRCASANHVPIAEKEILVKQLEAQNLKCKQLTRDLQAVLDEKEELVNSRDQFRHKFERLNQHLNYILRGDQQVPVDIDGILMENKYLHERIKQAEEEKNVTASALAKCKALLEKKRTKGSMKSSIASGLAVSAKQVEQLLQNNPFVDLSSKSSNAAEFRNLIITLLETVNDKSIALSHQKKTNKILGNRIKDLEEKIKSMEVSTLWRIPDPSQFSFLLRSYENDEKKLDAKESPHHSLSSGNSDDQKEILSENIVDNDSIKSEDQVSVSELSLDLRTNSGFSDLDILPTKDYSIKGLVFDRRGSMSSCSHYSDSKVSSASQSPYHNPRTLHSDSELTPKKYMNLNGDCNSSKKQDHQIGSSLDIDDLPPKLQRLIAAAFADIEKKQEASDTVIQSPSHQCSSSMKTIVECDPKC